MLPLAHAFLATAIEHDAEPAPDGLIELTVNEFRRLFHALLLNRQALPSPLCSPDPPGAEDTKPEPATATTDAKNNDDHKLRLQY